MLNYGREVPNFSEDTGLLASPQLPSETMVDSFRLGAEILETQDKYLEFDRQIADIYWEQTVVPKFAELGYEGQSLIDLTHQAKANLLGWREVFDEFNQRYPTLGDDYESDLKVSNSPVTQGRRITHIKQIGSLLSLLEKSKNDEVPDDQKELVEEVIDCVRRLVLNSQFEVDGLSEGISVDDRDLLLTNDEVIDWFKNYVNDLNQD